MPYWLALLTPQASGADAQQRALGWWALQFTPRVALLEEAVVAEVHASQRLFGGERALRERVCREAIALGCTQVAWAGNSLAALALARCGVLDGFGAALPSLLDALPLRALSAVVAQAPTLTRLGCRTLGEVRALPRGGLSRRFGKSLMATLDQAYGLRPQVHEWLELPEVFDVRLELPERVELAPAFMVGAHRLLTQMSGWLAARHAGVTSFTLAWQYESHRGRDVPAGEAITIRTADPTRQVDHIARLLSENLAKVTLAAAVDTLRLHADEVVPLPDHNGSLLPDKAQQGDSLQQLLERLSARLGDDKVVVPSCYADHRPEHVQTWLAAHVRDHREKQSRQGQLNESPQPTWLLAQPVLLAVRGERPLYQGALQFLAGPYRIESGWWDGSAQANEHVTHAARDYFVVASERAGVLWIFRERMGLASFGWYLHGVFG
jgi:protein ImuB